MNKYQTPTAVRHDVGVLTEEVSHLLSVTSEVTDEKIRAARERVAAALEQARAAGVMVRERAQSGARLADESIRRHPYESMLVALGIGTVLGCLLVRRN